MIPPIPTFIINFLRSNYTFFVFLSSNMKIIIFLNISTSIIWWKIPFKFICTTSIIIIFISLISMFFCYDYFQFSSGSKVPSNNIPFFQYCILFIKIKNLNSYFKKLIFWKIKNLLFFSYFKKIINQIIINNKNQFC